LSSVLTTTVDVAAGLVGAVFSQTALVIFIFLASIYINLGAHTYRAGLLRVVPAPFQPEIAMLLARIERLWNAFFRGQITLMLVIGVISWLGLTALGVPGALYLGIIAGLLELIPNLGPIIATFPAVIVALLQGSTYLQVSPLIFALLVVLFYVLVQQLENNLIVPRVLGDAVELPPLVVMTGVLVGASVGGILGALLAIPVIATSREILRYVYSKMLGEDPFPIGEVALEPGVRPTKDLLQSARGWFRRLLRSFSQMSGRRVSDISHTLNSKLDAEEDPESK
jgi:predicted PurR-regulated permease PerM